MAGKAWYEIPPPNNTPEQPQSRPLTPAEQAIILVAQGARVQGQQEGYLAGVQAASKPKTLAEAFTKPIEAGLRDLLTQAGTEIGTQIANANPAGYEAYQQAASGKSIGQQATEAAQTASKAARAVGEAARPAASGVARVIRGVIDFAQAWQEVHGQKPKSNNSHGEIIDGEFK